MIASLLRKELYEHRWILIALFFLYASGVIGLVSYATDEQGSPLVALRTFTISLGAMMSLALVNRLVVREYSGRTQLFLETLPVSRTQVLLTKWSMGAVLLLLATVLAFAYTLKAASSHTVLTGHFVALIAIRSVSYSFCFYALAFAIGLTGRYRFLLWILLLIATGMANNYSQLPISHWPPMQLVSESMTFERNELPLRDVLITWSITSSLIVATLLLALSAEGSFVVALSRRMLPGEKVAVTVVLLIFVAVISQLEQRKPKPPFTLHAGVIVTTKTDDGFTYRVAVAKSNGGTINDEAVAHQLQRDMQALRRYLAMQSMPNLSIVSDVTVDADVYSRADLQHSDGVVLRGALAAEQFDLDGFRAFALTQIVDWYTFGRSGRESRRWLLDGLAQWQIARESPELLQHLQLRAALASRLLQADAPLHDMLLKRWLTTREHLGECLSDAVAWRAVSLLHQQLQTDRFKSLMQSLYARQPPDDFRASFMEPSIGTLLRNVGAPTMKELTTQLRAALDVDAVQHAVALEGIALPPVAFNSVAMHGAASEVHYQVGKLDEAMPQFAVRYMQLTPWYRELNRIQLQRVDGLGTGTGVLPNSFQRGSQLFAAVELNDSQLGCSLRLGARRWELP